MKARRRADSWPERNQIGQRASRTADRVELLLVIFRDIVIERARPVTLFRCGVRRHFSYLSDDQMERAFSAGQVSAASPWRQAAIHREPDHALAETRERRAAYRAQRKSPKLVWKVEPPAMRIIIDRKTRLCWEAT